MQKDLHQVLEGVPFTRERVPDLPARLEEIEEPLLQEEEEGTAEFLSSEDVSPSVSFSLCGGVRFPSCPGHVSRVPVPRPSFPRPSLSRPTPCE